MLELSSTYCHRRKHSEFFLGGSDEHAHRLHLFIKNKSLSTNLNRKLPRLLDLCFYKLHYTDSNYFPRRTSFSMFYRRHRHDSCSRFTRVRCNVCYSHSFINLLNFIIKVFLFIENMFLKSYNATLREQVRQSWRSIKFMYEWCEGACDLNRTKNKFNRASTLSNLLTQCRVVAFEKKCFR